MEEKKGRKKGKREEGEGKLGVGSLVREEREKVFVWVKYLGLKYL